MKRFKFRLESVEKVRKSREADALRRLAEAQRSVQQARAHKARLERDLADALARREALGGEAISPVAFAMENDFIVGTKQRIIQADHAIQRAMRVLEKAMRGYLHARRQLRVIEILREKQYLEYRKEKAKYDQKIADELTMMRHRLNAELDASGDNLEAPSANSFEEAIEA